MRQVKVLEVLADGKVRVDLGNRPGPIGLFPAGTLEQLGADIRATQAAEDRIDDQGKGAITTNRGCCWTAVTSSYDGAGSPLGSGITEAEALAELREELETRAEAMRDKHGTDLSDRFNPEMEYAR